MRPLSFSLMGMIFGVKAVEAKEFQRSTSGFIFAALCGVPQPSLTSSAQPGSVQLTEQLRKGPSLQMVARPLPATVSEGLAAGLQPQPLTGKSLRPFYTSTKRLFRGLFSTPPLSVLRQGPATSWSLGGSVFTTQMGRGATFRFICSQQEQTDKTR